MSNYINRPNHSYRSRNRPIHYNDLLYLHMQNIQSLTNVMNETNDHLRHINDTQNRNYIRNRIRNRNNYSQSTVINEPILFENQIHSLIPNRLNVSHHPMSQNPIPSVLFHLNQSLFPNYDISHNTNEESIQLSNHIYNIDNSNTLVDISNGVIDISNHYILYNVNEYSNIPNPINDMCPITRERFYNNQNVYMIVKCKHIFNKSVLMRWFHQNNTCPTCREIIL